MSTILVVDDEPDIRLALTATLEDAGYEVAEASDGEYAHAAALESEPVLILLDINMPRMDGFEALKVLKNDERTSDIPVILITAAGDAEQIMYGRRLGAVDAIMKPWSEDMLLRRVREAAGQQQGPSQ